MAKKSLEERIQRLEDIQEIQNLMSRYEYWHTGGRDHEIPDLLFATKTPGVRVEIGNWGVYEGNAGVRRQYFWTAIQRLLPGHMFMHTLTTPLIEVAGDGKTAKGVWISPGHETASFFSTEGDKPQACWAWLKYGIDFVKEDGKWKIWHLHVYGIFHCPYDKSWVEMEGPSLVDDVPRLIPEAVKPDRPSSYHWMYSPTAITENVPVPPEPYATFDKSTAY